jgi:hypothetical protein
MADPSRRQSPTSEEERLADSGATAESDDDPLILWMLSLTPTKRLEVAQGFVDSVLALRNGRRA